MCAEVVFGDVEAKDKFIVQTWHRSAKIENGKVKKVVYGYSYPAYPPSKLDPTPQQFYRALLVFANYWEGQLRDAAPVKRLPHFGRERVGDLCERRLARRERSVEHDVRPNGAGGAPPRQLSRQPSTGLPRRSTSRLKLTLRSRRHAATVQAVRSLLKSSVRPSQ